MWSENAWSRCQRAYKVRTIFIITLKCYLPFPLCGLICTDGARAISLTVLARESGCDTLVVKQKTERDGYLKNVLEAGKMD